MDRFLIPANSKKSMLIFSLFNGTDLILFASGLGSTLLLLVIVGPSETLDTFIVLIPALLASLLVAPIPNYHNVRTAIKSVWDFYMNRQVFVWKGWLVKNAYNDTENASKK